MAMPKYPLSGGTDGQSCVGGGYKYGGLVLQFGGLGVGLTTSPCKRKFAENLQRENPLRGQGSTDDGDIQNKEQVGL
jgi:hypothetical protein